MRKLILNTKRKNATKILGLLFIANLLLFGLAQSYFTSKNQQNISAGVQDNVVVVETGWQVLNWSYSLLDYFRYEPRN